MLTKGFRHVVIISIATLAFANAAWCSRSDKGGSTYGVDTLPCAAGSGPQAATPFGNITVNCFSPGSGASSPALFDLKANGTAFPSTLDVFVNLPGGQPADLGFGLITCDSGNIPCTNKDSTLGAVNPVDFASDTPSFAPGAPLFTFKNFTGQVDFYVDSPAVITNVTGSTTSAVPEPHFTAAVGSLVLCLFGLIRVSRRRDLNA